MKEYLDSLDLAELLRMHKGYSKTATKTANRIRKLQDVAYASTRRAARSEERRVGKECRL